jgi:hypothetical protein
MSKEVIVALVAAMAQVVAALVAMIGTLAAADTKAPDASPPPSATSSGRPQ